jgi:hypothetical protein
MITPMMNAHASPASQALTGLSLLNVHCLPPLAWRYFTARAAKESDAAVGAPGSAGGFLLATR